MDLLGQHLYVDQPVAKLATGLEVVAFVVLASWCVRRARHDAAGVVGLVGAMVTAAVQATYLVDDLLTPDESAVFDSIDFYNVTVDAVPVPDVSSSPTDHLGFLVDHPTVGTALDVAGPVGGILLAVALGWAVHGVLVRLAGPPLPG